MPDTRAPETQLSAVRPLPEVPAALQALLLPVEAKKEAQDAITRSYYALMEGDPCSVTCHLAVIISALVYAQKQSPELHPPINRGNGQAAPDLKFEQLSKLNKAVAALEAQIAAGFSSLNQSAGETNVQPREIRALIEKVEETRRAISDNTTLHRSAKRSDTPGWKWWLGGAGAIIVASLIAFFNGQILDQHEQSERMARTLYEAPELGPWLASNHGSLSFTPIKEGSKYYHELVIHKDGLQQGDVFFSTMGEGVIKLPDSQ
jgi:hypothetical protein